MTDIDAEIADFTAEEAGSIDPELARMLLSRRLPRAELHSHLTGALRPSQVAELPAHLSWTQWGATHDYGGVEDFFGRLDALGPAFADGGLVREQTLGVLRQAVDTGCRHVELAVNHSEFDRTVLSLHEVLGRVADAFAEAGRLWGLTGGIILAADRGTDPARGLDAVRDAVAARERGVPVLGIGNDGFPAFGLGAFAAVFDAARSADLRTTAHANKPADVVAVVDLGLDRIDHAWELQGRPDLQDAVRRAGTPVTMAMSSCLMMLPGRFPTAAGFSFEELRLAGLEVTLNVDDGAMFATDSAQEYALAARTWDWDAQTLGDVAYTSLEAAWIIEDRDERLSSWRLEIDALVADPRMPRRPNGAVDPLRRTPSRGLS